jgi:hypothetical protein
MHVYNWIALLCVAIEHGYQYIKTSSCHNAALTPGSKVLLKDLTVAQLVKKFPAFYGTRR